MATKLNFIIKNVLKYGICSWLQLLIRRDENTYILSSKSKNDMFLNNTKYLFLYLSGIDKNCVTYLCDDNDMINIFNKYGYTNVYKRNSIKGIIKTLKSKYWFYDFYSTSVSHYFTNYAKKINLWHGIPLKKIEYDDKFSWNKVFNPLQFFFYKILREKHDYIIVNSNYEQQCYHTAFLINNNNKMPIIGSPRLDVLFHEIPNSDLFMEEDFANIKQMHDIGKKLIVYMPTFRDTGKDISGWLKSDKLRQILKENNAVMICKLHPFDKNSLDFDLGNEFYKMNSNSDVYAILKYTDALITDYSSINFDYLLLDKPIMYYVPDLIEYQEQCRGFYTPYEEFTVGEVAQNEDEIISAMQNVMNGIDNYKEKRKILRDKMFKYQDGKNCERVVEWIKNLDKKGK